MDTRWAGEVNLTVSAESLRISHAASNREIMNHSLPSISFASGGDGPTIDFIGYVAKDPVHERACHVFECVECSQYVLTTIGQAFELRYKMYLNSPHPEPLQIRNSIGTGDSWAETGGLTSDGRGGASLPREPPYSPPPGAGIYSDLPEFPSDALPSPSSPEHQLVSCHGCCCCACEGGSARAVDRKRKYASAFSFQVWDSFLSLFYIPLTLLPLQPSLTTVSGARPRVYSQLPGFPTVSSLSLPLSP
jgi:hypothetical protein